jgi:hypothetical protein
MMITALNGPPFHFQAVSKTVDAIDPTLFVMVANVLA